MIAAETLWIERIEPATRLRKVVYRLPQPVTFKAFDGSTEDWTRDATSEYVVVSWGRDGDTGIFPCRRDGAILNFLTLYGRDYWQGHDEAFTEWLRSAA